MIEINFDRRTCTATCPAEGVTIRNDTDPVFGMLRALANMGRDGPWSARDEAGTQCWYGHRLAKAARRYRPTADEAADIAVKAKARKHQTAENDQ